MKWLSIKTHIPPMEVRCFIFTENNYLYFARLVDSSDYSVWATDSNCDECGEILERICGVTHFCVPDPIEIK